MSFKAKKDELKGKVILITGASGGLGRAAAKACGAHGATTILLGKTIPKLEQTYDEIIAAGGPEPAIYPIDFNGATEENYQQLAEIVEKEFGRLDGLLHNAAELGTPGPIANIESAIWAKTVNVNLHAPFILTRVLLPLMQKTDNASIIFTTDSVARQGKAYWGSYGVTKIAAEGLAHTLAEEYETGGHIRVNILSPGPIQSPMRKKAYAGENPETLPTPESLEKFWLYLFSSASKGVTNQLFEGGDTL
jgi:NAD(P)-dependent dehydrogenase (short-subunit alcohol dehydrogenase family)